MMRCSKRLRASPPIHPSPSPPPPFPILRLSPAVAEAGVGGRRSRILESMNKVNQSCSTTFS